MAEISTAELRDTDLVMIRLTLRGRDGAPPVTVNESPTVHDLGITASVSAEVPVFDVVEYTRLMKIGGSSAESAVRMVADFNVATANFMADGGTPPAEQLAQAVVDWVISTRPGGHTYTSTDTGSGYVINVRELNIHGPITLGEDERGFRVTAVATWG